MRQSHGLLRPSSVLAKHLNAVCLPKISSAQVGGLSGFGGARRAGCSSWLHSLRHDERRAAAAGLPERDERVRVTAPSSSERPGQGRRDPGATAPGHGPAAATGHEPAAVLPRRSGVPGRLAAPRPERHPRPVPAASAAGHGLALAPEPAGPPSRGQIAAQAPRPATHHPLHPPARTAPGTREPVLGGTGASTANSSSSASRPPPPQYGRSSATPGSTRHPTAPLPPRPASSAPRPARCSPATSSRRSP